MLQLERDGRALIEALVGPTAAAEPPPPRCQRCGGLSHLPGPWAALRSSPVLLRWLLRAWAATDARGDRIQRMTRLCTYAEAAGLLAPSGDETLELVVETMGPTVLAGVLQQRGALGVGGRFALLATAIAQWRQGHQAQRGDNGSRPLGHLDERDDHAQALVGMCSLLHRELSDAPSANSNKLPTKKRSREMMTRQQPAPLCDACERGGDDDARSSRTAAAWRALIAALKRLGTAVATEPPTTSHAIQSLHAAAAELVGILTAPDIAARFVSSSEQKPSSAAFPSTGRTTMTSIRWTTLDPGVDEVLGDDGGCDDGTGERGRTGLWRAIWRRETAPLRRSRAVAVVDLVEACLWADAFSHVGATRADDDAVLGARVVSKVLVTIPDEDHAGLCGFLAACAVLLGRAATQPTDSQLKRLPVRRTRTLLLRYVRHLLAEKRTLPGRRDLDGGRKRRHGTTGTSGSATDVRVVVMMVETLHHVAMLSVPRDPDRRVLLFSLWDDLLLAMSSCVGQAQAQWAQFLMTLADCLEALKESGSTAYSLLCMFVGNVLVDVISSDGTKVRFLAISSSSADHDTVLALVAVLFSTLPTGSAAVVLGRVCQLLWPWDHPTGATSDCRHATVARAASGVRRLLLPVLQERLHSSSASSSQSEESLLEELFRAVIGQHPPRSEPRMRVAIGLLRVAFEWESVEPATYGRASVLLRIGIDHEIVRCFSVKSRIPGFPPRFLQYVCSLLKSAKHPPELGGRIFEVMSSISGHSSRPDAVSKEARETSMTIDHSDSVIRRALSAFQRHTGSECRLVLEQLRRDDKLEDLLGCLQRWVAISESSSVPRDTHQALTLLCNRIACHLSPTALDTIRFYPPDAALQGMIKSYAGLANLNSASPSPSLVRLNLMVRDFLAPMAGIPNLLQLTSSLVDSVVCTKSEEAFVGMMKLMEAFRGSLVVDVIVEKLRCALVLDSLYATDAAGASLVDDRVRLENTLRFISKPSSWWSLDKPSVDLMTPDVVEGWSYRVAAFFFSPSPNDQDVTTVISHFVQGLNGDAGQSVVDTRRSYHLQAMLSTIVYMASYRRFEDKDTLLMDTLRRLENAQTQIARMLNLTYVGGTDTLDADLLCVHSKRQRRGIWVAATQVIAEGPCARLGSWRRLDGTITQHTVEALQQSTPRLFFPFELWLRSALYASRVLPMTDTEQWEHAFSRCVVEFYLPIQFTNSIDSLLLSWIRVLVQFVAKDKGKSVVLGGAHNSTFRELLTCERNISGIEPDSALPSLAWMLLVECANQCLDLCLPHREPTSPGHPASLQFAVRHCFRGLVNAIDFKALCIRETPLQVVQTMIRDIKVLTNHAGLAGADDETLSLLLDDFVEILVRGVFLLTRHKSDTTEAALSMLRSLVQLNQESTPATVDTDDSNPITKCWNIRGRRLIMRCSYLNLCFANALMETLMTPCDQQ